VTGNTGGVPTLSQKGRETGAPGGRRETSERQRLQGAFNAGRENWGTGSKPFTTKDTKGHREHKGLNADLV